MRALVTGAGGFLGRHLVEHLESQGDEVVALGGPRRHDKGISSLDVRDHDAVASVVRDTRPDVIFHLAAVIAHGPAVSDAPADALAVTVSGTANVLAAARSLETPPLVHIPSSAAVYGQPHSDAPIRESHPIVPTSIYGATKASQEMLALAYSHGEDVPVLITRSFNHLGPGQSTSAALPSFATRLAEMALRDAEAVLSVGNLDVERDFSDVRDAVVVFRRLALLHPGAPVNVCTGVGLSLRVLLQTLIALSGVNVEIRTDPLRVRAVDPRRVIGDPGRLRSLIGSAPPPPGRDALAEIWHDACDRVRDREPARGAE